MSTRIGESRLPSPHEIRNGARAIREGRLVVFPTETVYGVGADALCAAAVEAIFRAKGRPADNPLIVHVADVAAAGLVGEIDPLSRQILERWSPGPVTVVVPARPDVPRVTTAGLATVAVRIPRHPVARALLEACGAPVAAPSANRSGEPSPTTVEMARRSLGRAVAVYLDGGSCEFGLESTVLQVVPGTVYVLRPGAVTAEEIREELPGVIVADGPGDAVVRSPGVRHRHYRPRATVEVFEEPRAMAGRFGQVSAGGQARSVMVIGTSTFLAQAEGPSTVRAEGSWECVYGAASVRSATDVAEYARSLYRWLAEGDALGVATILAELPRAGGLATALRDRLLRACGRHPV